MLNSIAPTTIRLPTREDKSMDFVIDRDQTVAQFIDTVKASNSEISTLDIEKEMSTKMGDLIRKRFNIKINNNEFIVHPDLSSMLDLKNRKVIEEYTQNHSFPVVRGAILQLFLDHLVTRLPKDPVSKKQLKQIIQSAVEEYKPDRQEEMLGNIKEEIKLTEEELKSFEEKYQSLAQIAKNYASKMLLFGVGMAAGQVGGFAYLIYGVYTWDDIEPVTYLVGAFYAWVSMVFYFRYREDWEWASAHDAFYNRKLRKLCQEHSFDKSRIDFLKNYLELLKLQLAYISK